MGNGGCGQFITSPLCCSFLLTLLSRAGWTIHRQQRNSLPPWNSFFSSGFGLLLFLTLFVPASVLSMALLSILKYVLTKASPSQLRPSAMPSDGSTGARWNLVYPTWAAPISPHWGHPCSQLLPQLWHLDPIHFNSVTLSCFHKVQDHLLLHYLFLQYHLVLKTFLFSHVINTNWNLSAKHYPLHSHTAGEERRTEKRTTVFKGSIVFLPKMKIIHYYILTWHQWIKANKKYYLFGTK